MIDHRRRRVSRSVRLQAARLLVVCGLALPASSLVATPIAGQDDGIAAPLPGADAMAGLASLAGRWTLEIPDGAGMRAEQTVEWDEAESLLRVEWNTTDGTGRTLAQGRGRIGWDDIAGAVVNTYAGRDGDRRFSGSATLIAIDGAVSDWRGHETRGSGGSVNFEVTYDLRDDASFVVDFIPTCLDGLETLAPVRFAWSRVDPFVEALPNADELAGEWELVSGGRPDLPNGTTMSVSRGSGGRSLVFLTKEPGRIVDGVVVPGLIMGVEQIWLDPETGGLLDRYLSMGGEVMTTTPRLDVIGEDEAVVIQSLWVGAEDSTDRRNGHITWTWVVGDELHLVFIDEPMTDTPQETLWMRR